MTAARAVLVQCLEDMVEKAMLDRYDYMKNTKGSG
jgi:hypothetical protein